MPSAAPLSIWDLFQNADLVVKLVMVGLLVASIMVWAIAIEKLVLYSRTQRAMFGAFPSRIALRSTGSASTSISR